MTNRIAAGIWLAAVLLAGRAGLADEGMYPLDSTAGWPIEEMQRNGLALEPEQLLQLSKAVAKVAGGGSGSFVSDKGLLVTNHHVAYRCLAALDGTAEHKGVMDRGFLAASPEQEIPCPGYDLLVVEEVRDVTAEVRDAVGPKLRGHRRFEAIRLQLEQIEEQCQAGGERFCSAAPLDGGRFYHLLVQRLIRDVRLVYAPEEDIGKYGGDVDNWRFPRHTGDYTFLRAYVGPDGKGAPYAGANVPFTPAEHLQVSTAGVAKGDQVLVIGFPARTKRNYPAASARFAVQTDMPTRAKLYQGMIELLGELGAADELTKRRYQSLEAGLNNAVKYYADSQAGFAKWKTVEQREQRDQGVISQLKLDPAQQRKHGKVLPSIQRIYQRYSKLYPKHFVLQRLAWLVKSLGTAYDIARWTEERGKPDKDRRDDRYKTKNMYQVTGAADRLDDTITIAAEKALLLYVLREAEKFPPAQRIKSVKKLVRAGKQAERKLKKEARKAKVPYAEHYARLTGAAPSRDPLVTAVDLMYAKTALLAHGDDQGERERALYQRRRLFFNDRRAAARFKDPLLAFGREVARELKRLDEGPYRMVEQTFDTELRPQYVELIDAPYPDANFQVRLSHGQVDDYTASEDGKTHRYITDLAGVIAKDQGEDPFEVPKKLKQAAEQDKGRFVDPKIGDVPVNFTCTLDTTGGNSGSPVLDSQGRLVGLLFDGTPESVLSDWQFLPEDQRSIVVDIRYALFLADKVHGAAQLLEELGTPGGDAGEAEPATTDADEPIPEPPLADPFAR